MDDATSLWLPAGRRAPTLVDMDSDYSPQQVAELLQRSEVQLIDVRQPDEHEAGRIAGDRLIELDRSGGPGARRSTATGR